MGKVGETGETFAFDREGLLLSQSRFYDDFADAGIIEDSLGYTMLNTYLKDPGGDITEGYPKESIYKRPYTQLVQQVQRGLRDTAKVNRGVLIKPYRNYRGRLVIGAWQWLEDLGFGVATEVEAREAFASLMYINWVFGGMFLLLLVSFGYIISNTYSLFRLKRNYDSLKTLGQYDLMSKIGEGGMGIVYLAKHAFLKRPTAVKVVKKEMTTSDNIKRFEREAKFVSQLTHPNTIAIYDYGRTDDGFFFYAMEYVQGVNLSELVRKSGALPLARALYIIRQVCMSLKEAHELGLVHRDIKPSNIMLCKRGGYYDVVKVLDFGLVKDCVSPDEQTKLLQVAGTPAYMPQERIIAPQLVNPQTDIYSVAGVLYFLLHGTPPYPAQADNGVDIDTLLAEGMSIEFNKELPTYAVDTIRKALQRDMGMRHENIDAFVKELNTFPESKEWMQENAKRIYEEGTS